MLITVVLGEAVERVEVPEEELLLFPRGVVGFEECTRYALFELESHLYLLQSAEDPEVGFVLLDPALIVPEYDLSLSPDDRALLQVKDPRQANVLCVVTLSSEGIPSSINLRAPLVISPDRRLGMQLIPQDSPYSVRHPLQVTPEGELTLESASSDRVVQMRGRRNGTRGRQEAVRC